jgi:phytoene dehydrogenase-like protein
LNVTPERGAAALLAPVLRRALLGGPQAARLGLPRRGLTPLVVDPALAFLAGRGSEVVTQAPVERLEVSCGRVDALVTRDGARHEAGAFVLAVPHAQAARLLPRGASPFDADAARRLAASPIVAVHLWFDRAVCDLPMAALLDSPFHWVFDRGRLASGDPSGYLALVTSAADELVRRPVAEIAAAAAAEVPRYLPRARAARLLRARVVKERCATPVFSPQTVSLRPPARTALANLLLAGDWTATGLPATLEGAAWSGHRAADLVAGFSRGA